MMFRRWLAAMLVLVLLLASALAEDRADAYGLSPKQAQEFVRMLFGAAAGTDEEGEQNLRANMGDEEISLRNAENAGHRARILPWLMEAFRPNACVAEDQSSMDDSPLTSAWMLEDGYAAFQMNQPGRDYIALLENMGGSGWEECLAITREVCSMWMEQINHGELAVMNSDYACWLYAPDTQIDYPVVQGTDNQYYLHRMFNGAYNYAGTLFMDYRNLPDFQEANTLIYGHHMRNDSMFGSLTDYARQGYYESHPFMLMMARNGVFLLEICAGYTTTAQDHCYDIAISDEEDMRAFVQEAMAKTDFVSGVSVRTTDRLVTMSTCAYAFRNARYVLIARILPVCQRDLNDTKQPTLE